LCETTGLARYRDRQQARHGAQVVTAGARNFTVSTFACPGCLGFHLEHAYKKEPIIVAREPDVHAAFKTQLSTEKRRYILFDVENLTHGAKATPEELANFWNELKHRAPGISAQDHIVVGAGRYVSRKYRAAIHGENIRWVVGADAPDGADRALLSAIDLHHVARNFDELLIMSGDQAFAPLARRAKKFGLRVHLVTAEHPQRRSSLSRELSATADTRTVVQLEPHTQEHDNVTPIRRIVASMNRRIHSQDDAA
jgi:hypothetical protein